MLKIAATPAGFKEIKKAIEARKGSPVNDATIQNVIENFKAVRL
jgi:hypothetical protein